MANENQETKGSLTALMSPRKMLLPFLGLMVIAGILLFTSKSASPRESTWDDVVVEAREGGYRLIDTNELKLGSEADPNNVLLIDTRQEWEFASGHIAGAINFPLEPTAWSRWWKKGELEAVLGPDKNRLIIFY